MEDADLRKVYEALLTGIGEVAQKQLCAQDKHHAWGPWVRYQVRHDDEDMPLLFEVGAVKDRIIHIAAERKCLCCGKVQHD